MKQQLPKSGLTWKQILLWDLGAASVIVLGLGFAVDHFLARFVLQSLVDLPWIGEPIYKSAFFPFYQKWHFWLFTAPVVFFSISVSYHTARVPGLGRVFLVWWQGLLKTKFKEEEYVDMFPPKFDRKFPEAHRLFQEYGTQEPTTRILGFIKRFRTDIEKDKREGRPAEALTDFEPLFMKMENRFRHIQVIGGSGSGKSASIIAPLLRDDAATNKIATLTVNPKADLYLIKVMVDGVRKRKRINPKDEMPTAIVSFVREDTLAYDPFLFGDADSLTKKIIYSGEFHNEYYRAFQETWLQSFFRVVKTEPSLDRRVMLRHLHRFLIKPMSLQEELKPLCQNESNIQRIDWLSSVKPDSLSGIAAHVGQLVEDESLSRIFDNPGGRYLNIKEVIRKGGNIFVEVPILSKEPQAKALGRMILMEMQLLSEERQAGKESSEMPVMIFLDEFGNFCWPAFTKYLSLCRSSRQGMLLAHQSIGNLESDRLPANFKKEIVDNTKTKFFLSVEDESALWASKQFGQQKAVKKTVTIGQNIDRTDTGAKENTSHSFREDLEDYLTPAQFNILNGYGFAKVFFGQEKQISGPMRVGYIDEKDLCTDEELFAFIREAAQAHGPRPRNGSLIDNDIDPGPLDQPLPEAPVFHEPALQEREKVVDDGLLRRFKSAAVRSQSSVRSPHSSLSSQPGEEPMEPDPNSHEELPQPESPSVEEGIPRQKVEGEREEEEIHLRAVREQMQESPSGNPLLDQFVNGSDDLN